MRVIIGAVKVTRDLVTNLGSVVEDERDERHRRRDRRRPVGGVEGGEHRAEAVEGRLGEGRLSECSRWVSVWVCV